MNNLKIPKDRVGVLIGKKGEIKRLIEKNTGTRLFVDKEGGVVIDGEGINVFNANTIIKAKSFTIWALTSLKNLMRVSFCFLWLKTERVTKILNAISAQRQILVG